MHVSGLSGLASFASGLYSLAWKLARPVLRRNRRLADGFAERLVPADWLSGPADLWIQAASGGEARLACALLDALAVAPDLMPDLAPGLAPEFRADAPLSVLVTTWTRQGRDILDAWAARRPERDPLRVTARFVPFDDPLLVRQALAQARPRLLVLLETELWPGLLLACKEAGVPVLVVNGRMRDSTLRGYLWIAPLWRALAPARVTAIAPEDAARYSRLFPDTPCSVIPNIKFDQAAPPPDAADPPDLPTELPHAVRAALLGENRLPLVLLASVREEEEDALVAALRQGLAVGGLFAAPGSPRTAARLIIAPRHMHRIEAWERHLNDLGLAWARRSAAASLEAGRPDVVLWDAFGELTWLYGVADVVFVGGSLAPLGGQNFLEPLGAGVIPVVGPHLGNFAWALTPGPNQDAEPSLSDSGLLEITPDAVALYERLRVAADEGIQGADRRCAVRARFADWLRPRQGGTDRQAAIVLEMIQKASPAMPVRSVDA